MRLLGKTAAGAAALNLAADTRYVEPIVSPGGIRVPKLTALLDGLGPSGGAQPVRAVAYDSFGALLAQGDEVVIEAGAARAWIDLPFPDPGGVPLSAGTCHGGLIAGAPSMSARIWGDSPAVFAAALSSSDSYADGAAATLGSTSTLARDLTLFATHVGTWTPPDAPEMLYGRLPFPEAQAKFAETAPLTGSRRHGSCGWHGTLEDPERGSFALVNPDGPFGDFLGERVLVSVRAGTLPRTVLAYAHNEADLLYDLSLPRRTYLALSELAIASVPVAVEVMS